ncbi:MAG TPA: branched-chain amino acid ABC transporter ATP-binding protein/permease [Solirubrobacterales bacterium]|nr:branched-chain amino acid ABC transporter ATP-binding protein/permease [Solirubrobacterales bacterium]
MSALASAHSMLNSGSLKARMAMTSILGAVSFTVIIALILMGLGSSYWMVIAISVATYATMGLGLNVVLGYAGLLDMGYAAFFAIGAYTSAILTVNLEWNYFLSIPIAIIVTGLAGIVIGYPTLRLRPDYLAIVTIGFGEVVRTAFNNWQYVGASRGLYPLPNPELFGFKFDTPDLQLLLTAVLLGLVIAFVNRLGISHIGRAWRAIRDDDFAAEVVGIPTLRLKIGAYVMGGAIGAVAGAIFASRSVAIDPSNFTLFVSVQILMIVVLGGLGSVRGVLLAATIFVVLPEILREVQEYRTLIFSLLVIVMVKYRPSGLIGERVSPDAAALPSLNAVGSGDTATVAEPPGPPEPVELPGKEPRVARGEALLRIEKVTQQFGGLTALDDVSLTVRSGEVLGLIGPNGAGKTTLVNAITGVRKPTSGEIWLGDEKLTGTKPHRIAKHGVARTFQAIRLFPQLSAIDNVIAGEYQAAHLGVVDALLRPRRERRHQAETVERAMALLDQLGIADSALRTPAELSYADRRRIEIARALASDPELLILDEPAAGMNPSEKRDLVEILRSIADRGIGILLIEHDMPLVTRISDRAAVLDQGRMIALGKPDAVLRDQRVIDAYLGSASKGDDDGSA